MFLARLLILIPLVSCLSLSALKRQKWQKRKAHIQRIKASKADVAKKSSAEKKKTALAVQKRFEKRHGIAGYLRDMPAKLEQRQNKVFLVNNQKQSLPVSVSNKAPSKEERAAGFYVGWFYDLQTWQVKHAYLELQG